MRGAPVCTEDCGSIRLPQPLRLAGALFKTAIVFEPIARASSGRLPMSPRSPRHLLAKTLTAAAAAYQAENIISHCPQCAKPCCRLDQLVLELDWKELKAIWQLKETRKEFDQRLAAGKGPKEIRAGNGLYYGHQKACPAFDEAHGSCKVYDQDIKPPGCSDFPVYENDGDLIADLRCEAVDLEVLTDWITRALGPGYRIVQSADEQFPFIVTLLVTRIAAAETSSRRNATKARVQRQ